jgi:hypothetical protein
MTASDKTHLANGSDSQSAYALAMSVTNIHTDIRCLDSSGAWELIGLLPIPIWVETDPELRTALNAQLHHHCTRIIFAEIRLASHDGLELGNAFGVVRLYFPLLACIGVDLPEARTYAGVMANRSTVTTAHEKDFGVYPQNKERFTLDVRKTTERIKQLCSPEANFRDFVTECRKHGLVGVTTFMCEGWNLSDTIAALMHDLLHTSQKFFFDHPRSWCTQHLGGKEIDFRFKLIPPRVGYLRFPKGISTLSKTGGRDHRNMMRHIVSVIDGAVPPDFMAVIRSQVAYTYLAQGLYISSNELELINKLLKELHDKKKIIIATGHRTNWEIPKLELQQHILRTIPRLGNLLGISTDTTEHAHIRFLKDPYRMTNKKDHLKQILQILVRFRRMKDFDMATKLLAASIDLTEYATDPSSLAPLLDRLLVRRPAEFTDFFKVADSLISPTSSNRTIRVSDFTAIHLNKNPSATRMSILEASTLFGIPSLEHAIQAYYLGLTDSSIFVTNRAISRMNNRHEQDLKPLDFTHIKVWHSIRVQNKSVIRSGEVLKASCLKATPPTETWPHGKFDYCIFSDDPKAPFKGQVSLEGS